MNGRIHPGTHIGQVQLKVSDLRRSIRFYEEVVGLRVLSRTEDTAELTADGERPLLLLRGIPDAVVMPRRSAAGLYHFALLLPDRRSLGLALRNLIASGIHIGSSDHLVSEALYIADPDNNGIELYADRPRAAWRRDARGEILMAVDPLDHDSLLREAGDEPWTGLPAGTVIGHIHLHVSDLGETERFYRGVLGFDVMAHMAQSALFVAAGGYHHHIGLNIWAGAGAPAAPANAAGLADYTIVVPDRSEWQAVRDRLREAGVDAAEDGLRLVFRDPSGIEIHLATN